MPADGMTRAGDLKSYHVYFYPYHYKKDRRGRAAVYTQLTDVEDELNGLLTYDREIMKIPEEILREINARVSGGIE